MTANSMVVFNQAQLSGKRMPVPRLSLADIAFGKQPERALRSHRIHRTSSSSSCSSASTSTSHEDFSDALGEELDMALNNCRQSPLEAIGDRTVTHNDLKDQSRWLRQFHATVGEFQARLDEARERTPRTVRSHLRFNHLQDTLNRAVHRYSRNLSFYHKCRADLMILTRVPASVAVRAEPPPDDDEDSEDGGDDSLDAADLLSSEFRRDFLNMTASG